MDGRLSSGEREKVERHLEGCSGCSAELESLRYTVSLLRRVPARSPRRVYTLAEAPPLTSTPWRVRTPVWAYGAAASVFVALFALVLSADLSGSLSGDGSGLRVPDQQQDSPAASERSELMSDPEAEESAAVSMPTATPEPRPTAMLMMEATPVPQPTPVLEAAADTPASTPTPQAAAVSRETAAMAADDPAPIDEQVAKEVASSVSIPPSAVTPAPTPTASPTAPTIAASPTVASPTDSFQQATTPMPTVAPSPTPVPAPTFPLGEEQPAPTPELLAQEVSSVEAEGGSTSIVWRVLEVLLGVAAVVLVGGILWRLRYRRGRTIS